MNQNDNCAQGDATCIQNGLGIGLSEWREKLQLIQEERYRQVFDNRGGFFSRLLFLFLFSVEVHSLLLHEKSMGVTFRMLLPSIAPSKSPRDRL